MADRLLKFFGQPIPGSPALHEIEVTYCNMARALEKLPPGPEKTVALRKLLESHDAARRTFMEDAG